jgi:cytochrome c oxidase cbb3-type subunit III
VTLPKQSGVCGQVLFAGGGWLIVASLLAGLGCAISPGRADTSVRDPYLGQPAAIDEGKDIYREKCIICHGRHGGRGPNLFATNLDDAEFLATVTNGRKGTLMPSFALQLTQDDIWKIRAFLKANPDGL